MFIYELHNTITDQYYIGSTQIDIHDRFWNERGGHVCKALGTYGDQREGKLYDSIREYGAYAFEINLVFDATDCLTRQELYRLEDIVIKEYFEIYGESRMLNTIQGSRPSNYDNLDKTMKQCHTPEAIAKRARTQRESGVLSEGKKSWYMIRDCDTVFKGLDAFMVYLELMGVDESRTVINKMCNGYFSKRVANEYPYLVDNILKLTKEDRKAGLTFESKYGLSEQLL